MGPEGGRGGSDPQDPLAGSHEPSFSSEDSNTETAARLEAIKDEQKATSPKYGKVGCARFCKILPRMCAWCIYKIGPRCTVHSSIPGFR